LRHAHGGHIAFDAAERSRKIPDRYRRVGEGEDGMSAREPPAGIRKVESSNDVEQSTMTALCR
jgi:hypothetical protein